MSSRDSAYRVLFVCTGNTCRSPLAAAALRAELGPEASGIEVASAGTSAPEGAPATESSIGVAARDGIDLTDHRAQRLTSDRVREADWIVVMERSHRAAVLDLGGDPQRTVLINEWPPPGAPELDVSDPFGGSMEAYEECWRRIRHHVRRMAPQVVEAARARSV